MTNINCTADCIYQKDGKCMLSNTTCQSFNNNNNNDDNDDCAYFRKTK